MKMIIRLLAILATLGLFAVDAQAASSQAAEEATLQADIAPGSDQFDKAFPKQLVSKSGSGHVLRFQNDASGRLSQISSTRGNLYKLVYANASATQPIAIVVNGVLTSLPLVKNESKSGGLPGDSDYQDMLNGWLDYMRAYPGCPVCVGLTDSLTDFWTYVGGGMAAGSVVGACVAEVAGASIAETGLAAMLGGVAGAAYFVALGGGMLFGGWVYDSVGDIVWEWVY